MEFRFAINDAYTGDRRLVGCVGTIIDADKTRVLLSFAPHRVRNYDLDVGQLWVPLKCVTLVLARKVESCSP